MQPEFKNVVAFSGGRTSAYMLHCLLKQHGDSLRTDWKVMFCNTGKELDATLDFVHQVETRWNIPVVWLEYTRPPASAVSLFSYPHTKSMWTLFEQQVSRESTHWFKVVNYETARRNGTPNLPFDEMLSWAGTLPNVRTRSCSVQMKVRTMMRYLFSIGVYKWRDHIGIRSDESHRTTEILANAPKYTRPTFPLVSLGITEGDVMKFWSESDFDLGLEQHQGNCDLCFLKASWKKRSIVRDTPAAVAWWESWEKAFANKDGITGDGKFFRKGKSYAALRIDQERQREFIFDEMDEEIPCGCFDRGFDFGTAVEDAAF